MIVNTTLNIYQIQADSPLSPDSGRYDRRTDLVPVQTLVIAQKL